MINFKYQGKENLDVMSCAKNYNNTIYKWIIKDIDLNKKIIDFGAGKGEFINRINARNKFAIELDKGLHKFINCPVFCTIDNAEFSDVIYTINVLEHIENDEEIFNKIYEYLKDDGVFKIFVPAKNCIYSSMDKLVGHFRRYEKKELVNKLQNCGFKIIECKYFDFLGFFISYLYKILKKDGRIDEKAIKLYDKIFFPISRFFDIITFGKIVGKNLIIVVKKN